MLAERIKRVVGVVVGEAQNTFIIGRFILDGVLIANEAMEYLRKKKIKSLIFKVDFEKAYDSINWRFLLDIMKKMGFGNRWCKWVESCLSTSSMSILVNGSPSKEFGIERGVRQGDHLSPFLFNLAEEGLNALVSEAVEKGIYRGVAVGASNVTLSHLQYADDTIFFGEWSKENANSLLCIIRCFEEVSGLRINYNKSKLYGIGVSESEIVDMARWNWGVPFYVCGVTDWGKYDTDKCLDSRGGEIQKELAFVLFLDVPRKWCWRVRKEGGSLWVRVIKSIHGADGGLGDVRALGEGLWGRGDGRDIRFWVDKWVDNRRLCDRFLRLYHLDRRKEVSVRERGEWVDNRWVWQWDWVRNIKGRVSKELEDLLAVLQHVVISNNCRDRWRWSLDEDGEFTVKEISRMIEEKIYCLDSRGRETLWNKLVPKKVNVFIWRALRGRIMVRVELDRRGVELDSILCPSCNNFVETCAHSLITCDLAMSVWEKIFSWWKLGNINAFTIDEFFSSNGNVNVPKYFSCVWQMVIWSTGYYIWKERNARVFGNKVSSTNKIVQDIQLKCYEWIVRRSKNIKR
ncbi:reverse transcriptase domain, reverse transcriptase zinc-binding domain protein [Tanacetum coccineum]